MYILQSLVTFVNKHLNKLGLEVTDLDTQFHDGVYLALLMGLLEGFFVPLYAFHNTPHDFDQKVITSSPFVWMRWEMYVCTDKYKNKFAHCLNIEIISYVNWIIITTILIQVRLLIFLKYKKCHKWRGLKLLTRAVKF